MKTKSAEAPAPVKCLLVDDLEDNLLTFSALLESPDIHILCARSGHEALELLLVHDVALALLDVQMPQMDGFELAELMRGADRTRDVPLIFVTAGSRDRQRLFKGYDAGAVDFLFKPIEPWILQSKVQVFVDLYRSKQRLAQELQERTETLRLKEMFSGVLAHDLRGPLTAMLTSATVIERVAADETTRASARRIQSSGRAMSRMIDDLLDLTRTRLGNGIPVHAAPTDLRTIAQTVVHQQLAARPDHTVHLECEGALQGTWDGDRLAQLLANLIANAVTHGDEGAPVSVRVDGHAADDVVISVTNQGHIAADLLPQLFEPFHRHSQAGAARDGLGLGLYIVKQVTQAHGGSVTVACPPAAAGEPTTVVFTARVPRMAPRQGA